MLLLQVLFLNGALRVPMFYTRKVCLPLDSVMLQLKEADRQSILGNSPRGFVAVLAEAERGVPGAIGTLCEVSACDVVSLPAAGSSASDPSTPSAAKAVGFSRFRLTDKPAWTMDGENSLMLLDVEPFVDAEPEDDEALRQIYGLTARRPALQAIEMRSHLAFLSVEQVHYALRPCACFSLDKQGAHKSYVMPFVCALPLSRVRLSVLSPCNVSQLLTWSGGTAAASATMARLSKADRDQNYAAVLRFAPLAAERSQYDPSPELCDPDEACSVGDAHDLCMLERAFLLASHSQSAEGEMMEEEDRETEVGARVAHSGLAAFSCPRHELYSFALSRLRDLSPSDAQLLLEGRSTACRLQSAEAHLKTTRSWLAERLDLGDLEEEFPQLSDPQEIRRWAEEKHQTAPVDGGWSEYEQKDAVRRLGIVNMVKVRRSN